MREIKFQVILQGKIIGEIGTVEYFNTGLWWFVDYRLPEDEQILDGGLGHLFPNVKNLTLDHLTYREYTGLRDNKRTDEYPKGQEIYEGCICSQKDEPNFVVESSPGGFIGVDINGWDPMASPFPLVGSDMSETEVIGNIYESPELLKAGQ